MKSACELAIKGLADIAIAAMDKMSPMDIPMSNVRLDFGEKSRLYQHAMCSVRRVADTRQDPADLLIAMSNELTVFNPFNPKDVDWKKPGSKIRRAVNPYEVEL
jgi:hypothetical protein